MRTPTLPENSSRDVAALKSAVASIERGSSTAEASPRELQPPAAVADAVAEQPDEAAQVTAMLIPANPVASRARSRGIAGPGPSQYSRIRD